MKKIEIPIILSLSLSNWRRGWDSNPRNGFPLTAFPVLPIQPLLHLSGGIFKLRNSDFEFKNGAEL